MSAPMKPNPKRVLFTVIGGIAFLSSLAGAAWLGAGGVADPTAAVADCKLGAAGALGCAAAGGGPFRLVVITFPFRMICPSSFPAGSGAISCVLVASFAAFCWAISARFFRSCSCHSCCFES